MGERKENMMRRKIEGAGFLIALGLMVGLSAAPAAAQRGPRGPGQEWGPNQGRGPHMGRSLDLALENQAELDLTPAQVAELQEIKGVMDKDVTPLTERIQELREQIRSGDMDRLEGSRQLQAIRGELMIASAPIRGRVQEILTVEQHRELRALIRPDRPFGRRGGVAGRGRGISSRRPGRGGAMQGVGPRIRDRRPGPGGPGGRGGAVQGPETPPAGPRSS